LRELALALRELTFEGCHLSPLRELAIALRELALGEFGRVFKNKSFFRTFI
jgi:hypothetical protein